MTKRERNFLECLADSPGGWSARWLDSEETATADRLCAKRHLRLHGLFRKRYDITEAGRAALLTGEK